MLLLFLKISPSGFLIKWIWMNLWPHGLMTLLKMFQFWNYYDFKLQYFSVSACFGQCFLFFSQRSYVLCFLWWQHSLYWLLILERVGKNLCLFCFILQYPVLIVPSLVWIEWHQTSGDSPATASQIYRSFRAVTYEHNRIYELNFYIYSVPKVYTVASISPMFRCHIYVCVYK